jgi:hypothetical protein
MRGGVTEVVSAFVSALTQFCTAEDLGVLSRTCRRDHESMDRWWDTCEALLSSGSTTVCEVLRYQRLPNTYAVAQRMAMTLTLTLLCGMESGRVLSFGHDIAHPSDQQCVEVLVRREAWISGSNLCYSVRTDCSEELDAHADYFFKIQRVQDNQSLTATDCARILIQLVVEWGEDTVSFVFLNRPEVQEAPMAAYWFAMGIAWVLPLQSKKAMGTYECAGLEHRITRTVL